MRSSALSYWRSFGVGLLGFILGGIVSGLATYIIFASGAISIILKLVPPDQSLVRLLLGLVLIFVGVGLGGAMGGLVRGYALYRIDPQGSQKRYLWGGAYSTWISQGILVAPIILLIGLISLYNNGSVRDPASYIVFFGLVGSLFGLLNGAVLSLITLRLRYAWLAWLGYGLASLVGGALLGVLVWRWEAIFASVPRGLVTVLFLILAGIAIYGVPGGLLGLIYARLSRVRTADEPEAITPRRWQDIFTITVFTLLFLFVASFIKQGTDFVTIYTGSVTTSITNPTQGIQWQASQVISRDVSAQDGMAASLAVGAQSMATTWTDSSGEVQLAVRQSSTGDNMIWSGPINVSKSTRAASLHPQVVMDDNNTSYVVWSEDSEIWYNMCQGGACQDPVSLSKSEQSCSPNATTAQNDWPAMALANDGKLMIAWQAGVGAVGYATWDNKSDPSGRTAGCLSSDLLSVRPRLTAGSQDEFWMAMSGTQDSPGNVSLLRYSQGKWEAPEVVGQGSYSEIFTNQAGEVQAAWCGTDKGLTYQSGNAAAQLVGTTSCKNRPSIFEDPYGRAHLVYATDTWLDNFGVTRHGNALMETIRLAQGWSLPAIIGPLSMDVQQETAGNQGGEIQLAWVDTVDGNPALQYATQPVYKCDQSSLSDPMKAVLDVVQSGEFHPAGYQAPFCGNHFLDFIFMPYPAPEFYVLPPGQRTGYDQLSDLVSQGKYEILFSNMQWDTDENNLSPGSEMARTITTMYEQVKAHPEAYPRGLTMKILLGNYPSVSTLQNGDQIWNVVQDFVDAGLPSMEDPAIGWKVELANYKGSMPHSHTKFIVIDGQTVMAAGFNIAWLHLPEENPSGRGDSLTDLGITLSGPVAQSGIAAFDDEWRDSNQLVCQDLSNRDLTYLEKHCTWKKGTVSHAPESLKYYLPGDSADAVGLYRTAVYKESDTAYNTALRAAQNTIDVIHVNFTAELICDLNIIVPTLCNFDNTLPYMHSMIDAMQQNGVHVRVMVEGTAGNGLENLPNIQLFMQEAAKRGLQDQLEIRIFNGRVHTKSAMIDDKLLFVGSQNFHYSSISGGGVSEFVIATDAPQALDIYKKMFEYYWQQGIPLDEWVIYPR